MPRSSSRDGFVETWWDVEVAGEPDGSFSVFVSP